VGDGGELANRPSAARTATATPSLAPSPVPASTQTSASAHVTAAVQPLGPAPAAGVLGIAAANRSPLTSPIGSAVPHGEPPRGTKLRFDGDGDQLVDMEITIALTDTPGKPSRSVHGVLTKISSGYSRAFDLEFSDISDPLPTPLLSAVTDGRHPTEFSLTNMCVLRVYPGQDYGSFGVLYTVAVGVVGDEQADITDPLLLGYPWFSPIAQEPASPVFSTESPGPLKSAPRRPVHIGDIWSLDLSIGLYRDEFRLSFRKQSDGNTIFGLAALSDEQPVGGERVDLTLEGPLDIRILEETGVNCHSTSTVTVYKTSPFTIGLHFQPMRSSSRKGTSIRG
jgi:hypothetical protein